MLLFLMLKLEDLDAIVPPSSCEFDMTSEIASPMKFFAPATEDEITSLFHLHLQNLAHWIPFQHGC